MKLCRTNPTQWSLYGRETSPPPSAPRKLWSKNPQYELFSTGILPAYDRSGERYVATARAAGTQLLWPAAEDRLRMWPVSRRVNRTGRGDDDPALTDEVAA